MTGAQDPARTKQEIKYPHPLDTCPGPSTIPPFSFHDYILRQFSCSIRNQPNWTTLVTNRKLMSQWIQRSAYRDGDKFSEKTDGFCLVWDSEDIKFAHEELVGRYKPRQDFDYYDSGTDGGFGSIHDNDEYEYGEGDAVEDDAPEYNENEILNPESEYHTWVPPASLAKPELNDEEIWESEDESSEEGEEGAEEEAKEEKSEENEEENDFDSIFAWKPTDIFDCRFYEIWDIGSTRPDKMWHPPKITDEINLKGKTVKIFVQMTNIMLTPENPVHHVGPRNVANDWAYHGLRNERIIATGIYYYAQDNIAETTLAFARKTNERDPLHPCNYRYCSYEVRVRPFQKVGKTSIKQNRLIVFPNIYAHATTLRLEDIKKPGYQKTLTFFLCDPNDDKLLTTKTVAPQQPQHRVEVEEAIREGIWGNLPSELFEFVLKSLPPPISVEEAYGYREAMIMTPY
ncbi:hypothetical protein TWF191_000165 [Orbilia oligospora]|uniref:Uncharacterized protein n=1 Tax=Orbilia oligospora TaxID=2813651 RepID=A0A7C8UZQ9_ORBOL|nr:hypothetical protein TWF191_000165 [Orbilia oligospora]